MINTLLVYRFFLGTKIMLGFYWNYLEAKFSATTGRISPCLYH